MLGIFKRSKTGDKKTGASTEPDDADSKQKVRGAKQGQNRQSRNKQGQDNQAQNKQSRPDPDFDHYGKSTSDYLDGLFGRHKDRFAGREDILPNAFLVGSAKSGTTTLFRTIREHPEIHASRPKEPKFFGPNYFMGWDWYLSLFEEGRDHPVRMEGSILYTAGDAIFRGSAQMIHNYIPNARLMFLARDPMERLVSHWRHYKGIRADHVGDFSDLFDREAERRRILESSLYWERLAPYRELFPKEQLFFFTFEDMLADPPATLRRIFDFLGVKSDDATVGALLDNSKFIHANAANSGKKSEVPAPEWDPALKEKVRDLIRPDALQFLDYIGKPAAHWPGIA